MRIQRDPFPRQSLDEPRIDPDEVRTEMLELLGIARAARDSPPWDLRIHRFYAAVYPQMARWLPADEAEQLCWEFEQELERLETLLAPPERRRAVAR